MVRRREFASIAMSVVLSACAHQLEITNLDDYAVAPTLGTPRKIAVLTYDGDRKLEPYFQAVVDGLRAHPSVEQIQTNWKWGLREASFKPDVVLEIEPKAEYSGSGWNFLITFPGFLIFMPAWNGYVYEASVQTEFKAFQPSDRQVVVEDSVKIDYSLRHCDFERAFCAETGWWLPGYGATSLLAGFFMIPFDSDATKPFQKEVNRPYGAYIAEKIMGPVVVHEREGAPGPARAPGIALGGVE